MELFKILGTIAVKNSDANAAIDETTGKAEGAANIVSSAFSAIGNAAVALGQMVVTGLAVATTAIVGLTAQSVSAYANYEQLVGGVETLFKDAQATVMGYAEEAYRTAGMSANQYLETVTGFSASLIQSLEGDTQKAAEKANQAILDMSDNANKMGTDIGSLQYAYQGFAKQNYTMLDNLKLGYGGTKEEMQRLLDKANELNAQQGIITDYQIENYADIVDAIHVVQTEMGITGATKDEAMGTISGSAAAAKAAWENLVTGLGDDNADLNALIDTFIDSLVTSADNMLPRIEKILGGIGVLVEKLVPKIAEKLPGMLQSLLPGLISGAVALFTSLVSALPGILQILLEQMPFVMTEISSALETALPLLLTGAEQVFGQLFSFIFNDLLGTDLDAGELFSGINKAILTVKDTLLPVLPVLESFLLGLIPQLMPLVEEILPIVSDLLVIIAPLLAELIPPTTELINALISFLVPTLLKFCDIIKIYIIPAIEMLAEFLGPYLMVVFDMFKLIWEGAAQFIQGILDFITGIVRFWLSLLAGDWQGAWDALLQVLKGFGDMIVGLLKNMFSGWIAIFQNFGEDIKQFFVNLWNGIVNIVKIVWEWLGVYFVQRIEQIKIIFGLIKDAITEKIQNAVDTVKEKIEEIKTFFTEGFNQAKDTVTEIFDNIKSAISEKIEGARDLVKEGIDKIKSFFNFEWSLPKLKLPHFKISGSFSLDPPSVPSFGVDWYAKGAVLNEPTAFGMNGNNLMVGGEAGPEAVAPISTLQKYIAEAVASQNADLVEVLYKILAAILSMDGNMGANMREALAGTSLNLDRREFARLVKAVN